MSPRAADSIERCLLIGACLATASCLPLRNRDIQTMETYLTAEEVTPAQSADVESLGHSFWRGRNAQNYLIRALGGPSAPALANLDLRFAHSYDRLSSPALSEADYVRVFIDNATAVYQARASTALATIGGGHAEGGIRKALRGDVTGARTVREDVRGAFYRSLVAAGGSRFQGAVSDSIGAVLDTIVVWGGAYPFDGDQRVSLAGGPFPDDVMVDSVGPVISFVLAAPIGTYSARVADAPPGGDQWFPVIVNRIAYTPAGAAQAPELWNHPSARRMYTVLTGAADTVSGRVLEGSPIDYFKVTPDRPVRVTASVEWRGAGWILPSWTNCQAALPGPGWLQGVVLDQDSRPILDVTISIVGTTIQALSDSWGRFRFSPGAVGPGAFQIQLSRLGFGTRTVDFAQVPVQEFSIWWDRPAPLPPEPAELQASPDVVTAVAVAPGTTVTPPYRVHRRVLDASLDPGQCRLLRLQKLDRDADYVLARVSVAFTAR